MWLLFLCFISWSFKDTLLTNTSQERLHRKFSRQLAIGSWQSAVGNRQLAIGSWQSAVGSLFSANWLWQMFCYGIFLIIVAEQTIYQ